MRFHSTRIKMMMSLMIGFCAFQLSAQSFNTMTISSTSLNADFTMVNSSFGLEGMAPDVVTGSLILADDGEAPETNACSEILNDVSGAVALIDRGDCPFVEKVTFAESAGAIAVLVCQDVDEPPFGMGADDPPVLADAIGIYNAMASQADCNLIKSVIANGEDVTVTFSYKAPDCNTNYDATVVWGQNGEGEFADGIGEWTTTGITADEDIFVHEPEGVNRGALSNLAYTIESPSLCNGAMIMDYDFLTSGGDIGVINALGFPYPTHSGTLESPTIDLSGTEFPTVEFYQFQLPLNGTVSFSYSIDNGETYQPEVFVETENVQTASITNIVGTEVVQIFMPEAADQSEVKLRFSSNGGDFYFWLIDDVIIRDETIADVRANGNFYAVAPNFKTPINQVDEMAFLIDIENTGNIPITGANVNATIVQDASGDVVYSEDLLYGDIAAGFLDENRVFPDTWLPTNEMGTYTGTYTLTSDNDEVLDNNVQTFSYEISEETFAKVLSESEAGVNYLGDRAAPNEYYQTYGNAYYVPNGAGLYAKKISFGVEVEEIENSSGFISVGLYQWIDINEDGGCQGDERILLWTEDIVISEGQNTAAELRDMEFDLRGEEIELTNDAHYVVMASMRPLSTSGGQYRIIAANTGVETQFSYSAMNLALSQQFETNRFGSLSGNGTSGTADDIESRELGFNGFWSVYMPLTIGLLDDLNVNEINNDLNVKVFPNPAIDRLVVDLILDNNSETVGFTLTTVDGKVVLSDKAYNVKNDKVELNITDVPSGMYMLNVTTEDGNISKKVVVNK